MSMKIIQLTARMKAGKTVPVFIPVNKIDLVSPTDDGTMISTGAHRETGVTVLESHAKVLNLMQFGPWVQRLKEDGTDEEGESE